MATPIPNAKVQFFDASGNPLSGGKLFSYSAGTVTPLATYTDATEATTNANPVILDSAGMANVWLGQSAYKLILQNSASAQVWSVDNVYGGSLLSGYITAIERAAPSGVTGSDILYPDSSAHRWKMINNNGSALTVAATSGDTFTSTTLTSPTSTGTDAGVETLQNKTLTSPVINGTPSGTGIPTLTQKKGSGGGDYTSTSVTYADVDGTNLAYTVTIPTGWKLAINASFGMFVSTAAVQVLAAISDGGSVLQEITTIPNVIANPIPTSLTALISGDGASHTIKLQFKTTNAADAVGISNSAGNRAPILVFNLTPSN